MFCVARLSAVNKFMMSRFASVPCFLSVRTLGYDILEKLLNCGWPSLLSFSKGEIFRVAMNKTSPKSGFGRVARSGNSALRLAFRTKKKQPSCSGSREGSSSRLADRQHVTWRPCWLRRETGRGRGGSGSQPSVESEQVVEASHQDGSCCAPRNREVRV